jgi:phosphoglycolate phosphatase-like HAD superfamily hydrolase
MTDPRPVTEAELRVFRKAGGLNNDWDMSFTLIALRLAGRANTPKELAAVAAESRGRGRAWAAEILPRRVRLDYDLVTQIFNEYYWGGEHFERVFGVPGRIDPPQPGFWQREVKLLPADLPDRLRAAGVRAFGIATGRTREELNLVYESAGLDQVVPEAHILTSDTLTKPDGRVLDLVLTAMQRTAAEAGQPPIRTAIFCGDTMDDLQAVVNYRGLAHAQNPVWMGAVAVAKPTDFPFFQQAGSDAAVTHVAQVEQVVDAINQVK